MDARSATCPHCLALQTTAGGPGVSEKTRYPTLALCLPLGVFGAHRFYVGKTNSAILQLVTLGGLGIWMLADLIVIAFGAFSDGEGKKVTKWT